MDQPFITLLLFILTVLFVFKANKRLDQDWYSCRAIAESVKTSTWRFSLRAHPFDNSTNIDVPKEKFRNFLNDILQANKHMAANLKMSETAQVTESMIAVRKLPLQQRVDYYVEKRIDEQHKWYSRKSTDNEKALTRWFWGTIFLYVLAVAALYTEKVGLDWTFDPLIVVVTSALGWIQMKRHGELMASYNLAAQEISIIMGNSESISTEDELSDFVNEAELAFSREHTQWVARRDAN